MCYDRHIDKDTLKEVYKVSTPQFKYQRLAVNKCLFTARQNYLDGNSNGCLYLQFVKHNEDFAQQLTAVTLFEKSHPR